MPDLILDVFKRINWNLTPATDNKYDLGSSSYRWSRLYLGAEALVNSYGDFGSLRISGTEVISSARNLRNVSADASIITSGVFSVDRIPDLPRSKITDFWATPFWPNILDKPSAFPPEPHASSHRPGGGDPLFPADFSLTPATDNAYDLGSSSMRWRDLWLGRDAYIQGKLDVVGNIRASGSIYGAIMNGLRNYAGTAKTVTETTPTLKDEVIPLADRVSLIPMVVKYSASNPAGSGVTLYVVLRAVYTDTTTTDIDSRSLAEGESVDVVVNGEALYDLLTDGKVLQKIQLLAYCSAVPTTGYEPTVTLTRVAGVSM